jgi:hypothetical protein
MPFIKTAEGQARALLDVIPSAPRQPGPRARKLIFAYAGAQKVLLIVGVAFLLIGLVMTIPLNWGLPVDFAITFASKRVDATVRGTKENHSVTVNGEHPTIISYEYQIGGAPFRGSSSTRDERILALAQPGGTIPVETSRLRPGWSRVAGTTYSMLGYLGLLLLLFPGIGAVILIFVIRANRREIRAYRHGVPVVARVVSTGKDYSTSINGQHPFLIRWEFRVGDEIYEGKLSSMSLLAIEDLMDKDEVAVLYDQENPRINTVFLP